MVVERGQEYQRAIAQLQGLEAARQRLKEVSTHLYDCSDPVDGKRHQSMLK
jgi:hypothetical protein